MSDTKRAIETIDAIEVVLPAGPSLAASLEFFCARLGMRVEAIHPADDPSVAVVVGHGVRLRLERGYAGPAGRLRLRCADPSAWASASEPELLAPNGTRVELVAAEPTLVVPPLEPALVVTRASPAGSGSGWVEGRAGMRYRDLIPSRLGGRFVASHIRIDAGGPVPDYVHHHAIRLQMIYCHRGWVRVVYEDQGPPFVLEAGDCVLQPPHIRHQVLESSPGLEVVEVGCPAEHETRADLALTLPTTTLDPGRDFGGQRFVRHRRSEAVWEAWRQPGYRAAPVGFGPATGGLAEARVIRLDPEAEAGPTELRHAGELLFGFVRAGGITLRCEGQAPTRLGPDDAFVIPAGLCYALEQPDDEVELLELTLPGALPLA